MPPKRLRILSEERVIERIQQVADVKVGNRVVIEAKKDSKDATKLVAHMVMIGQMDGMAHHDTHE